MTMEKINLFWAIIWGLVFVTAIVGIFWNPAHFVTAAISGIFCGLFIHDYIKAKAKKH